MGRPKKVKIEKPKNDLDLTMQAIIKQHGKGSIMFLGDITPLDIPSISTGSVSLDLALGIGGLPRGRVIEVLGNESSGKTSLCLALIAEVQKTGQAAFVDAEHALDREWAEKLKVDLSKLLFSQPDNGEQALDIVLHLVESNKVDLIIVDSVAALTPKAEIDGEMGQAHMGLQARLMSQAMRKLTAAVSKSNTCLIFINQIRMKIGIPFGNPETTCGGRALKFYSSVRIDLRRGKKLTVGEKVIGQIIRAKVLKNKVAPPFETGLLYLLFNEGFSAEYDTLMTAIEKGIIKKSGSWLSFEDKNIAQGLEKAKEYLKSNPKVLEKVKKLIKDA